MLSVNYKNRWLIPYLFALPWVVVVMIPIVTILLVFGIVRSPCRKFGNGVITVEFTKWAANILQKLFKPATHGNIRATTIGHLIIFFPGCRDEVQGISNHLELHEYVHVCQHEDKMISSFFVGAILGLILGSVWVWLGVWFSGGLWTLTNFIGAVARYGWKNIYWGAEHERAAYAEASAWRDGKSWSEYWWEAQMPSPASKAGVKP